MGKTVRNQPNQKLFENIKALLHEARKTVARNINTAMTTTYFEIGRLIVDHKQIKIKVWKKTTMPEMATGKNFHYAKVFLSVLALSAKIGYELSKDSGITIS